ncbi:hypothetical protein OU415_31925 [Saccharopolyspora sp. WRP15-2]|uniref:Uncharacterized protein n=1 Tax=Saccharopolyspora oryzae TaxID=2997343 RepID=A0ABT4V7Z4_9PSEU|nr:hypothetical protein [Saccharopolyspora oryzae]MDA3630074.1 hypothetical protein [Saccharopolyspora oryzae]
MYPSRQLETRSPHLASHRPHVYRNLFMGTWICDQHGTRANPGPDSARTVYRTHLDAVRAAVGVVPEQRLAA